MTAKVTKERKKRRDQGAEGPVNPARFGRDSRSAYRYRELVGSAAGANWAKMRWVTAETLTKTSEQASQDHKGYPACFNRQDKNPRCRGRCGTLSHLGSHSFIRWVARQEAKKSCQESQRPPTLQDQYLKSQVTNSKVKGRVS